MAFDAHKNLAIATVATPPNPSTSGTTLSVASGAGARFPAPPFNATLWPAAAAPTPDNAEVVRVTAVAGDGLTITRIQEGSLARAVVAGDLIAATITAKTLTDIEAGQNFPTITTGSIVTGTVTESGRPAAMGYWVSNPSYLPAGWTGSYRYAFVGKTLTLAIYAQATLAAGTAPPVSMTIPGASILEVTYMCGVYQAGVWALGQAYIPQGSTALQFYPGAGNFTGGATIISLTAAMPTL